MDRKLALILGGMFCSMVSGALAATDNLLAGILLVGIAAVCFGAVLADDEKPKQQPD